MEAALTAVLLAHAPLSALIGDRVHWQRLPRSVDGLPYVNLQVISGPRRYHSKAPDALKTDRVQADVWAETAASRKAVADTLESLLSGYRGSSTGIAFRGVFMDGGRDLGGDAAGGTARLFRRQMDFMINWKPET